MQISDIYDPKVVCIKTLSLTIHRALWKGALESWVSCLITHASPKIDAAVLLKALLFPGGL